jgi:hypothetical protein
VTSWSPIGILPNLRGSKTAAAEFVASACDTVAFVGSDDLRVQAICEAAPKFTDLLSRFTDAFGVALDPVVFIVRDDALSFLTAEALLSFRDVVAISIIPYCRSLNTVHRATNGIAYSNTFWIYPWTLSKDNEWLTTSTPAFSGIHDVEAFRGQSSPELPVMEIDDLDSPLLEALVACWKRHYFRKGRRWKDRALFRSLNMAVQAASLPAGVGTTIFDLGRSISLWVSAFEILSHPRIGKAGLSTVYPMLEGISFCERNVGRRRYAAYNPAKKKKAKEPRRSLASWVYGKLYQARNDFLHGNRVSTKTLSPKGTKNGLFWLAPSLYRLALTGFLKLSVDRHLPYWLSGDYENSPALRKKLKVYERQSIAERALLRIRK